MDTFQFLRQILKQHDYCIELGVTPSGCVFSLPMRLVGDVSMPKSQRTYDIDYAGNIRFRFDLTGMDSVLVCPPYACRLAVNYDLLQCCHDYEYDPRLVRVHLNDDEKVTHTGKFLKFLPKPSQEVLEKESKLNKLFTSAYPEFAESYNEVAEQQGITDGYEFLKNLVF